MPKYRIESPDGRPFEVEGDSPPTEQELESIYSSLPGTTSTSAEVPEEFRQQFISQRTQDPLKKAIEIGVLGPKMVGGLLKTGKEGIEGLAEIHGRRSIEENPAIAYAKVHGDAAQSTLEGIRKAAFDPINATRQFSSFQMDRLKRAISGSSKDKFDFVSSLIPTQAPQTLLNYLKDNKQPSEEEIQDAYRRQLANEAEEKVRETPLPQIFGEANPKLSEAISLIADPELAAGVVGARTIPQLAKAATESLGQKISTSIKSSKVPKTSRMVRSALKPSNSQLGEAAEKATTSELNDVFNVNPNADSIEGIMPIEGFKQSISSLKDDVGTQIDIYRSQVGNQLDAGNQIAKKLREEGAALKSAGKVEDGQYLIDLAAQKDGSMTTMKDLQRAVTFANQENAPFFQRSFAAQNPARANVNKIANDIIAQEGGRIINKELEAVGGEGAELLRKKWSNLTTLERQASERINKIINAAPPEIQSTIYSAFTSPEGMAGLAAIVSGYPGGLIPLAGGLVRSAAKKALKEMKDSNVIIQNLYKQLRRNPPERTSFNVKPPIIPDPQEAQLLNQQLLESLRAQAERDVVLTPSGPQLANPP